MGRTRSSKYVSRGGDKLAAALLALAVDPQGLVCADFGCNVGGFTDCLLQHGAAKVYAIDTGYGELAWALRKDPRVVVMERTNALHVALPEPVSLVTVDVAWTRQHLILPAAASLLDSQGRIVTLIKPHYEAERSDLRGGVLPVGGLDRIMSVLTSRLVAVGISIVQQIESPLRGQKGNTEFLALIRPNPRHAEHG